MRQRGSDPERGRGHTGGQRRRVIPLACAVIAFCLSGVVRAEVASRGRLLGTGSGTRVWWIDVRTDGAHLMLLSSSSGSGAVGSPTGEVMEDVARYAEAPEAIATSDDRVWLVFPPSSPRPDSRDVVTFAARRNPATGLTFADPPGGADLVASLPASGDLAGFVAVDGAPWALIAPSPAARFGVRRDGDVADGAPDASRLFALAGNEWRREPMPASLHGARGFGLAIIHGKLAVVAPAADDGTIVATRVGSGDAAGFDLARLAVPFAGATWIRPQGRTAIVRADRQELRFEYLRDEGFVPWANMSTPTTAWFAAGDAEGAVIVSEAGEGFARRRLGGIDIEAGPLQTLEAPGFRSGAWIHVPLIAGVAFGTILMMLILRTLPRGDGLGTAPEPVTVPPLAFEKRAIALVLDLIPGAVVAMWMFGVSVSELFALPAWSLDRTAAEPAAFLILVTCVHAALGEALWGRSLGKALVGARVTRADGSRATTRQVIVRGCAKFLTLAAPILVLFVFFMPARRSLGDVLAGTVVTESPPAMPKDAQK